mmetsp:Transcript_61351/g.182763  ORF Transcript_61351/g.182763 Transcript_61351/m.182763 type:complete len:225 (+) Transcript_61351:355-1029(+)
MARRPAPHDAEPCWLPRRDRWLPAEGEWRAPGPGCRRIPGEERDQEGFRRPPAPGPEPWRHTEPGSRHNRAGRRHVLLRCGGGQVQQSRQQPRSRRVHGDCQVQHNRSPRRARRRFRAWLHPAHGLVGRRRCCSARGPPVAGRLLGSNRHRWPAADCPGGGVQAASRAPRSRACVEPCTGALRSELRRGPCMRCPCADRHACVRLRHVPRAHCLFACLPACLRA